MEIKICPKPSVVKCHNHWSHKMQGVVLVEKEEDIEPLWKLLCEQDDYWDSYKELIKVAPKEIEHESDLKHLCQWCGKTDIDNIDELKLKIPFILFQYYEDND
jgi:hypothetical protein